MNKGTIEDRLDVLQAEAALKTNAREAAAHMISGIGKIMGEIEKAVYECKVDEAEAGDDYSLHMRLVEALDARAGMLSEAIVHDTVADDVNDGPEHAPTREPMPVSTTAAPLDTAELDKALGIT